MFVNVYVVHVAIISCICQRQAYALKDHCLADAFVDDAEVFHEKGNCVCQS